MQIRELQYVKSNDILHVTDFEVNFVLSQGSIKLICIHVFATSISATLQVDNVDTIFSFAKLLHVCQIVVLNIAMLKK